MKKQLLALAVAGAFAVPAMAQVTVSGVLDARAYVAEKLTTTPTTGATTTVKTTGAGNGTTGNSVAVDGFATSQIVFTMSEDLGGGLRATGYFAQRLLNTLDARDRYLELTGGFGGIRVGRFAPTFTANWNTLTGLGTTGNAGSHYQFITTGRLTAAGVADTQLMSSTNGAGTFERQDSMIQYTSPNMSGLVAAVGLVNSSSDSDASALTNKAKTQQYYLTVNYSAGPLALGAGLAQKKSGTESTAASTTTTTPAITTAATTGSNNKTSLNWLGGSYNLGVARLHATYATRDNDVTPFGGASSQNGDANLLTLAASVPLGATTVRFSIYDGKDKASSAATDDIKLKGYQLSAVYDLSKRTSLYAVMGQNKRTRSGSSTVPNLKYDGYSVGLRHTF